MDVKAKVQNHLQVRKNRKGLKAEALLGQLQLQSMVWPALLFIILFAYIPMYGNIIAFLDYNVMKGFIASEWVGLKYFKEFFIDPNFFMVLRNTIGMNMIGLAIGFPAPILFALFINELTALRFKKFVQTVSYLPHFLSWAVYGGLVLSILSPSTGILNTLLLKLGLIQESVAFIAEPKYTWIIIVMSGVFKGLGWGSIIYLAAIAGVDQEQYESAIIDGAGRFQKMWYITLPSIAATLSIMIIFAVAGILNSGYEQIIVLQNPLNLEMSEAIDTYVYKLGIRQFRYSYSTAVGLTKALIALLLLLGANFASKKISDNSLF